MRPHEPLRGVIFDLDGTLVDSALDFDAMRRDMGLPEKHPILEALAEVASGPDKDRMLSVLRDHELRGADRAVLFPGVQELLDHLLARDMPLGLLTRNSRESTDRVLARLGLSFTTVLTRDEAPPKPDPTGLLAISHEWNLAPQHLAFCGDYRFDLEAGRAAGMWTILFAPNVPPDYAHLADAVITDFHTARRQFAEWIE